MKIKLVILSISFCFPILANDIDTFKYDQLVPLSSLNYYPKRYEKLKQEVNKRFIKYFTSYHFSYWQPNNPNKLSETDIKKEFLTLNIMRRQIWVDTNSKMIQRAWEYDFMPNLKLIQEGLLRNPNCISFNYNKINDYYNGSLIIINDLQFIAMEAPSAQTLPRFFYALLDTNTSLLVRLTPQKENNVEVCFHYWNKNDKLIIPIHKNNQKEIDYLSTDDWSDNTATNVTTLLDLILKAKTIYNPNNGPMAVHCAGGVGRTGTFIAAYCIIKEIDKQITSKIPPNQIKVSIEEIVAKLSLQRYYMVARPEQYLLLYQLATTYYQNCTQYNKSRN
jgi:protein tyrosine phosphatase